MVEEWKSQLAKASRCQRERWHHLPCVKHIATWRVRIYLLTSQSTC